MVSSVFLVGFLLLLAAFSGSRSHAKNNFLRNHHNHKKADVSTDQSASSQHRPLLVSNEASYTEDLDESNFVSRWYEEDFPDDHSTPGILSLLEIFRKKVAITDRVLINPHDFDYIHNSSNACTGRKVELIAGIPSKANTFESRMAIRDSWGKFQHDPANNMLILFFLGVTNDQATQEKINQEALKYGDIVQETFVDSYRNLSLKTVALMKWVSFYCPDSTFVLKAEDDAYINIPRLLAKLREQLTRGPMFIMGAVHHNTVPFRDQKNKWYVTRDEYPWKTFPNYLSGTAYALTSSAAMRLYVESLYVKNLFLEDVYLTGLVADRAAVPRIGEGEFSWAKVDPNGCIFKYKISGHKYSPDELRKIHDELIDPSFKCY